MFSTPADTKPEASSTKDIFDFFRLPVEIQDLIFDKFDGLAAIKFRQTNRRLYRHPPFFELKKQYVHQHDTGYNEKTGCDEYACYLCHSIRPRPNFTEGTLKNAAEDPMSRCCIPCGVEGRRFIPGQTLIKSHGPGEEQDLVCCVACIDVKEVFCTQCQWCDACLKDRCIRVERSARNCDGEIETYTVVLENKCNGHQLYQHGKPATEPAPTQWFGPW